ncbi:MAG: type VI secretion system membrane subunit TssM [Acidobacteriota bacterium]
MPALGPQIKSLIILSLLAALTGLLILFAIVFSDFITAIVLVALILLCWPLGFWLRSRRMKQSQSQPAAAPDAAAAVKKAPDEPSRAYGELMAGVAEVFDFLRRNKPGGAQGDAVYNFPWFVVAGPPGSGKTSLLLSSGFSFNALESQRRADQNLLRPTGGADWRVSDEAVWVDTAGRYQTDSDDRDEWLGLIAALKKYRRQRPLDGMLIVVSLARLLVTPPDELEHQAQLLRARLGDMMRGAGYRFPVYLVFTNADAVNGFSDYFKSLGEGERAQVWGATIPLAQADKAHALFDTEFDYLLDALLARRLTLLGGADEAHGRIGVFDFPLYLYQARRPLGDFTMALFKPSPFSELPLLRGIYFTSSPAPPPPASEGQAGDVRVTDKGFFTEDLFRQVVLRDKDIAASFVSTQAKPNLLRKYGLATAAVAIASALWLLGMVVATYKNFGLIEEGKSAASEVAGNYKGQANAEGASADELAALDRLQKSLANLDELDDSWFSAMPYRFGLYTGGKIKPRLREIYFDFVSQRFLRPALIALAQDLGNRNPGANAADPKAVEVEQKEYYDKLKTYLSLETQKHIEPSSLIAQLSPYWKTPNTAVHLDYFARQASLSADDDTGIPRPKADAKLRDEARKKLETYSVNRRVYQQVIDEINSQGVPLSLSEIVKGEVGWIDNSKVYTVPYAYTKQAYYKHILGDAIASIREKLKEDWVMGKAIGGTKITVNDLEGMYYAEYATEWQKFLKSLSVRKFDRPKRAVEVLNGFENENSPLKAIVKEVTRQTKLTSVAFTEGPLDWFKAKMSTATAGAKRVETSFNTLIAFADGTGIDDYKTKLGLVRRKLDNKDASDWGQLTQLKTDQEFRASLNDVRSTIRSLDRIPGAFEFLDSPPQNIEENLQMAVAKATDTSWEGIVSRAHKLESSYPFAASSTAVVSPTDLTAFLNDLITFYEANLKDVLVGNAGQFSSNNVQKCSEACVNYFNQIFKLRNALYTQGPQQPRFDYGVTVSPLAGRTIEMNIEGKKFSVQKQPAVQQPFWPVADNPGITGAIATETQGQASPQPPQEISGYPGTWGIFKLVGVRSGSGPYRVAVQGISMQVQPPTVNNPFEIDFGAMHIPQNLKGN